MDLQNLHLNLFLIRHAQPENPPDHWTSASSPLSEKGKKQAQVIAKDLSNHKFTELVVSPFLRTKQTVEYIQQAFKNELPLSEQEWLAEIDLGKWAGKHKSLIESDQSYPNFFPKDKAVFQEPLVARLLNTNKIFSFPGGESLETFWNRVQTGFLELINTHRNEDQQTLGLIGHGGSFSVITSILLGKSFLDNDFPIIAIKMAKYAHIRIYKRRVVFVSLN